MTVGILKNILDKLVHLSKQHIMADVLFRDAVPYHERYYLKYREGKRNTVLDLDGTKSFLQEIGFDGGELRQAREGKNCAENMRNTDKNKNNQMFCSYCGTELSGVEFFRLPDGRMRCNTCSDGTHLNHSECKNTYKGFNLCLNKYLRGITG